MPSDFSLRIYYPSSAEDWSCEEFTQLPVSRPCVIIFHVNQDEARPDSLALLDGTRKLLAELQAAYSETTQDWHSLDVPEANWLHVIVCKGNYLANLEPAILQAADKSDGRTWILPVFNLAERDSVSTVLGDALRKRNVAFWENSILELPLTLLARAGVTTLDRRAFISYRRIDASPIADQLFDALHWRNFDLFLDRVSIEPGVDFQASLFAQLSHKSLVVLLNSRSFPDSEWTKAEIRFARERRLSLIILRLPDAQDSLGATASEEIVVEPDDIEETEVPGFSRNQSKLLPAALDRLVQQIVFQHDRELIGRVRDIRLRLLDAGKLLETTSPSEGRVKVKSIPSEHDSAVTLEVGDDASQMKRYTIYPSAYPPDIPELYDAANSARTIAEKRFVVGHLANMLPLRTNHLDWIVKGRNVGYCEIDAVSLLFDLIAKGKI
jgi:TIR domain